MTLLLRTDVVEKRRRHLVGCAGGFGERREAQRVAHPRKLQHVVGVFFQSLVFAHQVVVDVAGVAERVNRLPVFVQRSFSLRRRVHQVLCEFLELDVGAALQRLGRGVLTVPSHDLCPVALVEGGVVAQRELVAVSGH